MKRLVASKAAIPLATALIVLAVFGPALLHPGRFLGLSTGDLALAEAFCRDFGFQALRRGVVALWNPTCAAGTPFLGAGQMPLFYPPNWLHLFLPLPLACTLVAMLHVYLLGLFFATWAVGRGVGRFGAVVGAALLMLGGPVWQHVLGGHLNNLSAMAWFPLMLIACDWILERRPAAGGLLGTFAMAMTALAGQPQYLYYAGIVILLYIAARLPRSDRRLRRLGVIAAAGILGLAVAGIELLPLAQQARESIRAGAPTPYWFAGMFSLPPENLLTAVAPRLFGDGLGAAYWGRFYFHESCMFVGVSGLLLTGYGALYGEMRGRRTAVVLTLLAMILALGSFTPLFGALYRWAPGFDRFRGCSKFAFHAATFGALLAAGGLDSLLKRGRRAQEAAAVALMLAALLGGGGVGIFRASRNGSDSAWTWVLQKIADTQQSYLLHPGFADGAFTAASGSLAARACLIAAAWAIVVAILFRMRESRPAAARILGLLAVAEVVGFALTEQAFFPMAAIQQPQRKAFFAAHPGDYRVAQLSLPNGGMATGARDIWSYDSFRLRRYAELMAVSQGANPDDFAALMWTRLGRISPLCRLMRLEWVLSPARNADTYTHISGALPHVFLARDYHVAPNRDASFAALTNPRFDPGRTVILNEAPNPLPAASDAFVHPPVSVSGQGAQASRHAAGPFLHPLGSVSGQGAHANRHAAGPFVHPLGSDYARVESKDTNTLTITARCAAPALLVITDAYSLHWRARALPGSAQAAYKVAPADWAFQAIPLGAGDHHIRMEFAPGAWPLGRAVTLGALALYGAEIGLFVMLRRRSRAS